MDAQSTHALKLEHGEQELGRIPRTARAGLDGPQLELAGFDLQLGGQRGTAETRHFLIRSTITPDFTSASWSPRTTDDLSHSPRPVNPVEYVSRRPLGRLFDIAKIRGRFAGNAFASSEVGGQEYRIFPAVVARNRARKRINRDARRSLGEGEFPTTRNDQGLVLYRPLACSVAR
jgi:hypothetical protein